jgi:hypothetical protein
MGNATGTPTGAATAAPSTAATASVTSPVASTPTAATAAVVARPSSLASRVAGLGSNASAFPEPAGLPNFDALLELGEKAAEMVLERVPETLGQQVRP